MKSVIKNVKYDGKLVGSVNIPLYETLQELSDSESTEHILNMFNKGNTINLQRIERDKHKPASTGKQARTFIGMSLLTTEEAQACCMDPEKLKELIDSTEVQDRIDTFLAEREASTSTVEE